MNPQQDGTSQFGSEMNTFMSTILGTPENPEVYDPNEVLIETHQIGVRRFNVKVLTSLLLASTSALVLTLAQVSPIIRNLFILLFIAAIGGGYLYDLAVTSEDGYIRREKAIVMGIMYAFGGLTILGLVWLIVSV